MQVCPVSDIRATILQNGELALASARIGNKLRFPPAVTAMWIALREHNGDLIAASRRLADAWEEEFSSVHSDLVRQVEKWLSLGIVEVYRETAPSIHDTGSSARLADRLAEIDGVGSAASTVSGGSAVDSRMSSLIEALHRREAAARQEKAGLRREIEALNDRLAQAEDRLFRLELSRETAAETPGEAGTDHVEGGSAAAPVMLEDAESVSVESLPATRVGVLAVPPWRRGPAVAVLPKAYRDLVEVLVDAGHPLRAVQVAAAVGLSIDKSKVEGLRAKLKRLVDRGWLTEAGPGRFTAADREAAAETSRWQRE